MIAALLLVIVAGSLALLVFRVARRPSSVSRWRLVLDLALDALVLVAFRGLMLTPLTQWGWLACLVLLAAAVGTLVWRWADVGAAAPAAVSASAATP